MDQTDQTEPVAVAAERTDGLPRCQHTHPELGQCAGIAGIEDHRHYSMPGNRIWVARS